MAAMLLGTVDSKELEVNEGAQSICLGDEYASTQRVEEATNKVQGFVESAAWRTRWGRFLFVERCEDDLSWEGVGSKLGTKQVRH